MIKAYANEIRFCKRMKSLRDEIFAFPQIWNPLPRGLGDGSYYGLRQWCLLLKSQMMLPFGNDKGFRQWNPLTRMKSLRDEILLVARWNPRPRGISDGSYYLKGLMQIVICARRHTKVKPRIMACALTTYSLATDDIQPYGWWHARSFVFKRAWFLCESLSTTNVG